MGSSDEFGPDTETIRAWLSKRATYADDVRLSGAPRAERAAEVPVYSAQPTPAAGPDSVDAGRSVLAALGAESSRDQGAATPPPEPAPAEVQQVERPDDVAAPSVQVGRWTEPVDNLTSPQATTDVDFPARTGVRRALSLTLLVALVATGVASYVAWRDQTTSTLGIAVSTGVLTLVVWAVRAGATVTRLSIRRGQLVIRRGGRTETVDIASRFTPVAIVGEPGQRRWRVLVERAGLPLVVLTPSMVDPHWFTTSLYRVRPDLRPEAQAALRGSAQHSTAEAEPAEEPAAPVTRLR